MEIAQPLLAGKLPVLQLDNKQPKARHQCSDLGHAAPHLPGRNTSSSFVLAFETNPDWFWLTSLRSSSRLREQQQTPTWKHKHLLASWHWWKTTERLLGLSQGWLCPPQILLFSCKIMWETTYLGNLCDFNKYFEQSWSTLGGLNRVNQCAFLIITKCLLVCLYLLWNPVKYFLIRKEFLAFSNCSQREATFSDPVLGDDCLKLVLLYFV